MASNAYTRTAFRVLRELARNAKDPNVRREAQQLLKKIERARKRRSGTRSK